MDTNPRKVSKLIGNWIKTKNGNRFHFGNMYPNQIKMLSILEIVSNSHGILRFYFWTLFRGIHRQGLMSREEVGASMEVPGVGRQTLSDCKWSGKMEKIEQKLKKNKESYSQKEKI